MTNSIANVSFGSCLLGWAVIENESSVCCDGLDFKEAERKITELSANNPANTYFPYLIA